MAAAQPSQGAWAAGDAEFLEAYIEAEAVAAEQAAPPEEIQSKSQIDRGGGEDAGLDADQGYQHEAPSKRTEHRADGVGSVGVADRAADIRQVTGVELGRGRKDTPRGEGRQ